MESISIVIPAYNEEQSLAAVVQEIQAAMVGYPSAWEIIIVDDGSSDGTAGIAAALVGKKIRLLRHETNLGSGRAIRTGMEDAKGDLVVYVPADGQFDPREIPAFAKAAKDADIVIGYRLDRHGYGPWRKCQSRVYVWLVNWLFGQRYRDVNWVHLWRTGTAGKLPLQSQGVFMQQELLTRAGRLGLRVVEVPSEFRRRTGGLAKGSRLTTVFHTWRELTAFRFSR